MIKEEDFLKVIELLNKISDRVNDLYSNYKIDLIEYEDDYQNIIYLLLGNVFTEQQLDWFSWWMYERISTNGEILQAWDENKNEIDFDTPEKLYEFLKDLEDKK